MANTLVTTSWVIREASVLLDNYLIGKKLVYTDYSDEFTEGRGETVTMKLPNAYEGRTTMVMNTQDTTIGSVSVPIDKTAGVDIQFTDRERTFSLIRFREEVLQPAMRTVANIVDRDIWAAGLKAYNWTGTAGTAVDGFDDIARAAQRLEENAVPEPMFTVLTPGDKYGLLRGNVALTNSQPAAKMALEDAEFTSIAGMKMYATQNLPTLTTGTRVNGSLLTNGASQTSTWASVRTTQQQSLVCDGFAAGATVKAGEVFTLGVSVAAGMVAVNPVPGTTTSGKPVYDRLQQFTVISDATADGSGNITLTISPAIITSGPYQTVSMTSANTDGLALTFMGSASTTYRPSLSMHRNAIAFVNRPLVMPEGVTDCARETYKGLSMRFAPVWDGINSVQRWRFDVVYGVTAIRPDLMTRLSGA